MPMTIWGENLTAVLCYHDLCKPRESGSWLKVDIDRFERQLVALKKIGTFVRPDALLEPSLLTRSRLNLLLTFDDGFINNLRLGLPVLKRHGVPALFFISTEYMESGEPFWFDRLIRPIEHYCLPGIDLRHLGLGEYSFSPVKGAKRWDDIQLLLEDVKKLDESQDGQLVDRILAVLLPDDHQANNFYEDDRPLNKDELMAMQRSGICCFGSHGHRHRILTKLGDDSLKEELQQSRSILEELLGEPVKHISYPNGNVDSRVVENCREAGYLFGYTIAPGRVSPENDHFRIPRVMVGGFDTTARVLINLARGLLRTGPQAE
ncbi:polysaccharide deacetylase family protein [Desulfopila sp. IMCC35006]|uniref:polysaccharide deacetylase family protein n=1 Tax=Desulfopila sp. IMCC35006 TaxID=2569542 RepID=UPI0010AB5BFA|nr:polysaccharide deacetylase family protein [Desulfopila sp. IMCC35006]TKB23962.1 polysaccharide deacetylase family protein [Desulfopila sp. IMCC35006]